MPGCSLPSDRCAGGGANESVVLAKWASHVGGDVSSDTLGGVASPDALASRLAPYISSLRVKGGCVLFCYSCILTRGVDKVKAEAVLDGGGVPLVSGPFALCGTELISLLLKLSPFGGADGFPMNAFGKLVRMR